MEWELLKGVFFVLIGGLCGYFFGKIRAEKKFKGLQDGSK